LYIYSFKNIISIFMKSIQKLWFTLLDLLLETLLKCYCPCPCKIAIGFQLPWIKVIFQVEEVFRRKYSEEGICLNLHLKFILRRSWVLTHYAKKSKKKKNPSSKVYSERFSTSIRTIVGTCCNFCTQVEKCLVLSKSSSSKKEKKKIKEL
jgi:hypothetical protein